MALIADVSKLISTWFNLNCRCQRFKKTLTISRYFLQKEYLCQAALYQAKLFWLHHFGTNHFVPKLDAPFQIKPTWENSRGAWEKLSFFWVFHALSPFKLILVFLMHIEIFLPKELVQLTLFAVRAPITKFCHVSTFSQKENIFKGRQKNVFF